MNEYHRRQQKGRFNTQSISDITTTLNDSVIVATAARTRGRWPVGTTYNKKKIGQICILAAKNDIVFQYKKDKGLLGKNCMKHGCLDAIITEGSREE